MVPKIFVILAILTSFNVVVSAQEVKINLVILCNDKLINEELSGLRFVATTADNEFQFSADYVPGDLILKRETYDVIMSDSVKSLKFLFDLNTFSGGGNHQVLNVKTDFPKGLFDRSYLVLNVFDFSDRKYRRQLGYLTKDDFITEFSFPGSGTRLIRRL